VETDGLTIIVGAHDAEIERMKADLTAHAELIDLLTDAIRSLTSAVDRLPTLARRYSDTQEMVERHDRTLRAMHKGLHQTSDPT
jgi:hypothetical protein